MAATTSIRPLSQAAQNVANPNVFLAGKSYWFYFLYAKPSMHQTYSFYIGNVAEADALAAITSGMVDVTPGTTPKFTAGTGGRTDWITQKQYDASTGVLSVTVDLGAQTSVFEGDRPQFCQPAGYCSLNAAGSCGCKPGSNCTEDAVCAWATKEIDCPLAGCFGFALTMPQSFTTAPVDQPLPPPAPIRFAGDPGSDPYFSKGNITFFNVDSPTAGSCYYPAPPMQASITDALKLTRAAKAPPKLPWNSPPPQAH